MTKPRYISASQIDQFRTCPRKWAWQYLTKYERAPSASTEFGKRVHAILEAYLKEGTPPDIAETFTFEDRPTRYPGKTALQMINRYLPKPGTAKVEGGFTWQAPSGINYTGIIDVHWYDPGAQVAHIVDHKTSIDPEKYGKTIETLKVDPQFILYARVALAKYLGAAGVAGVWNYGSTKAVAKHARPIAVTMYAGEVMRAFEKYVEPYAAVILKLRESKPSPLTLTPNADACELYGGCDFKHNCNLTPAERIAGIIMSGSQGSLMDEMIAAAGVSPNPAATPIPQGVQPPPVPGDQVNPPESTGPVPTAQAPSIDALLAAGMPQPTGIPSTPAVTPPAMPAPAPVSPAQTTPQPTATPVASGVPPMVAPGGVTPGVDAGTVAAEAFDRLVDLVVARVLMKLGQ